MVDNKDVYNPIASLDSLHDQLQTKQKEYAKEITSLLKEKLKETQLKEKEIRSDKIKKLQSEIKDIDGHNIDAEGNDSAAPAAGAKVPEPAVVKPAEKPVEKPVKVNATAPATKEVPTAEATAANTTKSA